MNRVTALMTAGVLCLLLISATFAFECGKRKVVTSLITFGAEAKAGYWPWHVALFINRGKSFEYACGGSIVDKNTVLTAAHCVRRPNGIIAQERLVVQVGRNRLGVSDDRAKEHEVFKLLVHPQYDVNGIDYDIALIKLATDITYTDYVQPVCLWNRGENQEQLYGTEGTVVGFGFDETNAVSDSLREAEIPVVSTIKCIESNPDVFGTKLTSRMFCAGTRDGVAACNGDSGGGLFFNFNNIWYVRGVVSFTKPQQDVNICDPKEYTVFSDVALYLTWVKTYMRDSSAGAQHGITTDSNPKLSLLPLDSCGANPYGNQDELQKPLLLGYPWTGLLEYSETGTREKKTICQATLISDLYLITAAHCIKGLPKRYTLLSVRLGEYNKATTKDCDLVNGRMECAPPVQIISIESVFAHKNFNTPRFANDIGLVRLRDRADTSQSNVKPICLPFTNELRSEKPAQFTLTTWPIGSSNNVLQRSRRDNIDSIECQKQYREQSVLLEKTTRQICVKQVQDSSTQCNFPTSGSPLQAVQRVKGNNRYVLHGLLSYGPKSCSSLYPDVYTSVSSFVDWILASINE